MQITSGRLALCRAHGVFSTWDGGRNIVLAEIVQPGRILKGIIFSVHPVHAHVFLHAFSWQSTIHYQGKWVYVKNCLHLQVIKKHSPKN